MSKTNNYDLPKYFTQTELCRLTGLSKMQVQNLQNRKIINPVSQAYTTRFRLNELLICQLLKCTLELGFSTNHFCKWGTNLTNLKICNYDVVNITAQGIGLYNVEPKPEKTLPQITFIGGINGEPTEKITPLIIIPKLISELEIKCRELGLVESHKVVSR